MHLKYVLQKNEQVLYIDIGIDINRYTEIYRGILRIGWADHRF